MPPKKREPSPRVGRGLLLRPLRSGDLDSLLEFANAVVKEKKTNRRLGVGGFDRKYTRKSEGLFLRDVIAEAKSGNGLNLGAFAGGSMVGFCTVKRRIPSDLRHTGVLGIVVLAEYRGVGIGRKLMRGVLRGCPAAGVWLVELEVMATNQRAITLYEGLGFRRAGVVPGKVLRDGKPIDMIAMFADLRGTDKSPGGRRRRG